LKADVWARVIGAGLGVIGGFILGYGLVQFAGVPKGSGFVIGLFTIEGFIFAYLSTPYVLGGWRNIDLRLKTTPLPDLIAGILGMMLGLLLAVLIGYFVRAFSYGVWLSAGLALLLALSGANLGLTRRSELMALFGLGGHPADKHRIKAALLDTSVIIDGRILDLVRTGFLDMPLVVTQSVLRELQWVADASDPLRRSRGRRGLEILTELRNEPKSLLEIYEDDTTGTLDIDNRLVRVAKTTGYAILTNDYNLNSVARLEGALVLNLNDLVNALKSVVIPGEPVTVSVVREGREPGQGVAYLDDGTMVVVENGRGHLNQTVTATVTSILQTAAGRMIFAQVDSPNGKPPSRRAKQGGP
jgi:uncharacterized protein YacL